MRGGEVLGLTTEAVNLLRALNRRLYVIAIASSVHLCAGELEEHFPPAVSGQIIRMLYRKVHPDSPLIQVLHRDPGRYFPPSIFSTASCQHGTKEHPFMFSLATLFLSRFCTWGFEGTLFLFSAHNSTSVHPFMVVLLHLFAPYK